MPSEGPFIQCKHIYQLRRYLLKPQFLLTSNPNVSNVAKDHFRRVPEVIEGTSGPGALVGEKQKQHKPVDAARKTENVRKFHPSPSRPSKRPRMSAL
ncbi:hypothetical protein TRAPUB_610 [Trametes pubescens]|uniref:Uncharacterized protein n=1 Tax=Trametes pubescens TaxID=154538 RepID=A0A1M2VLH0_TRAPU|nr:hypothetical protein TRAPUB_610 [Trametes pubescens]